MMDKQSAINLIRETFEKPFEKERFVYFAKNLFNRISPEPFEYSGQFIPDTFKPYLSKYERIGKYTTEDKRIDILIVYLNKETSIERARTMQRNFVAGYLMGKYGSPIEKDAAVVAFVSPGLEDWRFSLVKMEYKLTQTKTGRPKAEEEFTPAKRYSFLVGKNEPNHTAQQQLLPILMVANNPTLDQIEMAFSVEKVAKEFLNKYLKLYLRLKGSMDRIVEKDKNIKEEFEKKKVSIVDFSKKLLGQIVFLYFLQKKGWLGVPKDKKWGDGDRNFLRSLFKVTQSSRLSNKNHKQDACDTANFFNDYLKFLFYDTLNNPRTDEADPSYSKDFDCRIPFLNGGLFEPNYAWKQTDIIIPNGLFSNQEKTKEGDIGSGILDVFDCFNFTVCEDEPLEKEVALDPELLGKVFENLIEENLRKGQGAYYTPREIVHYMCQESLINYLGTELEDKITKADIELFIKYGEHIIENEETALRKEKDIKSGKQKSTTIKSKMPESIKNNAKLIDDKLANIRVCDPAVGSGAFPVGMMLEIVKARNVLTNYIVTQPSWLSDNEHKQDACDTVTQPSWLSDNIYFASDEPISIKSRNLPHWEQGDKAYFVTFRLYDSIPKDVAENIRQERENWLKENRIENTSDLCKLDKNTQIEYYRLFSKRYDELLDNNYGSCVLANSDCKQIVESALMHFNNERYYLDKYVIMPNHVHVIVIPKEGWILSQ
ncbi:MAG: class I SAM-dependent DNA methyltransferase, partial [bacterium]